MILIEIGAESTVVDNFGRTPRIVSRQHGNVDIMKSLELYHATNDRNQMPKLHEAKLPVWFMTKPGLFAPLEQEVTRRKSGLSMTERGSNYIHLLALGHMRQPNLHP